MGDYKHLGVRLIEDLYREYHHSLCSFFTGRGIDRGIAEDLTQDVFLRILRSGREIASGDHGRNLVYRVAQNLAIDYFRKSNGAVKIKVMSHEDLAEEEGKLARASETPEDQYLKSEEGLRVRSALSRLPRHYAEVVVLKDCEGLSYREIANGMGVSEKAVESLLYRARGRLKRDLVDGNGHGWLLLLPLKLRRAAGLLTYRFLAGFEALFRKCAEHMSVVHWGEMGAGQLWKMLAAILITGTLIGTGITAVVGPVAHGAKGNGEEFSVTERLPEGGEVLAEMEALALGEKERESTARPPTSSRSEPAGVACGASPVEAGQVTAPSAAESPGVFRALVSGGCEMIRFLAESGGEAAEFFCDLGGALIGIMAEPVLVLLAWAGVPEDAVICLRKLARMEVLLNCVDAVVRECVELTYRVEDAVGDNDVAKVENATPATQAKAAEVGGEAEGPAAAPCALEGEEYAPPSERPLADAGRETAQKTLRSAASDVVKQAGVFLEEITASASNLMREILRPWRALLAH